AALLDRNVCPQSRVPWVTGSGRPTRIHRQPRKVVSPSWCSSRDKSMPTARGGEQAGELGDGTEVGLDVGSVRIIVTLRYFNFTGYVFAFVTPPQCASIALSGRGKSLYSAFV